MIVYQSLKECQEWVSNNFGVEGGELSAAIGYTVDEKLVCVTGYNQYHGKSCHMHVYSTNRYVPRDYWWFVYAYPFVQLGVEKLIAIISSANKQSLKLAQHCGFKQKLVIPGGHKDGDLIVNVLEREDCKFLSWGC